MESKNVGDGNTPSQPKLPDGVTVEQPTRVVETNPDAKPGLSEPSGSETRSPPEKITPAPKLPEPGVSTWAASNSHNHHPAQPASHIPTPPTSSEANPTAQPPSSSVLPPPPVQPAKTEHSPTTSPTQNSTHNMIPTMHEESRKRGPPDVAEAPTSNSAAAPSPTAPHTPHTTNPVAPPAYGAITAPPVEPDAQTPPAKKVKYRVNQPWTPAEEQRLKVLRDAGNSWGQIAKDFPNRTEGSVKKHWYKDMHYAEFAEDESAALLAAIKEYEINKWKVIGQKLGKPAKACEQYAKEHFAGDHLRTREKEIKTMALEPPSATLGHNSSVEGVAKEGK